MVELTVVSMVAAWAARSAVCWVEPWEGLKVVHSVVVRVEMMVEH